MALKEDKNIFKTEEASLLLVDPSLENGTAGISDLLISIDHDLVSIALISKKSSKIVGFEQFAFPVNGEVESVSELIQRFEFRNVKAAVISPLYTFIPDALFKEADSTKYFRLNCSDKPDYKIFSDHV